MFLHAGASLHGHEYSSRQSPPAPQIAPRRILLRSALGTPTPITPTSRSTTPLSDHGSGKLSESARSSLTSGSAATVVRRLSLDESPAPSLRSSICGATPSRRPRPVSELVGVGRVPTVRFESPVRREIEIETPPPPAVTRTTTFPPAAAIAAAAAVESVVASEDEGSFLGSEAEGSDASASTTTVVRRRRKTRRASSRNATNFLLAQAPPRQGPTQRLLHLRPRLLLQLQQLSADRRPKPAVDVLPSSLISGTLLAKRLARRFPRISRLKDELGLNDFVLVRSEDYDADDDASDDDDAGAGGWGGLDRRELVGVVSPTPRREDEAEIVLADGAVWTAVPMANGSYELTHVDAAGVVHAARWVRRSAKSGSGTATGAAATAPPAVVAGTADYTYKFSLINPLSRRHPIMATLTPCNLEILDHYTTISASSGRYPPSKPFPSEVAGSQPPQAQTQQQQPLGPSSERTTLPVDEATRTLITVSAVWMSLRHKQGWPTFNGRAHARAVSSTAAMPAPSETSHHRSSLILPAEPTTTTTAAAAAAAATGASRTSMGPRQASAPTQGAARADSPLQGATGPPRRTLSTGAAYMQRRRERQQQQQQMQAHQTVLAPESEAEEAHDDGAVGYVPVQSHGKFYRKLRALKDRLTLKGTRSN